MNKGTRLFLAICSNLIEVAAIIILLRIVLPYWGINTPVYGLVLIILAWIILSTAIYRVGSRALDQRLVAGLPSMVGTRGVVVKELSLEGTVRIKGEYWRAVAQEPVCSGHPVEVVSQEGMLLIVKPLEVKV
ncbi:MAG: NfeD family protein [Dehalococcoidales bacterium]|nr:NfeD family protein [Dehalococcoidales bacterium]MDD3264886.1 NfeD family protein [Dehalococcoidales bacterium]MDD5122044.1 NfeD family protein [Dehalococcoidales bacterium]